MKETTLFNIPVWTKEIPNFNIEMKNRLIPLLDEYPERRIGGEKFLSNRHIRSKDFVEKFFKIISTELKELFASVQVNWSKSKKLTVVDAWSVKYNTGDYQRVHNHSSVGLSGILYVDVPQDAPFLDIIQPWNSWVTDKTEISSVKFKEGGLVVFPSFIQHGTQPNESQKAKRVIAFDMKIV